MRARRRFLYGLNSIRTGTINTFYETYRPKGWTQVPYGTSLAKLLDADTYTGTTAVDLDLVLRKPDGTRIGTYRGHAAKSDDFVPNKQNQPGARLNWALSQAIYQIRQALLQDANVTNASANRMGVVQFQSVHE